jgi:hypothetical protein
MQVLFRNPKPKHTIQFLLIYFFLTMVLRIGSEGVAWDLQREPCHAWSTLETIEEDHHACLALH